MLGVRREGITHAAKRLQNEGYISYVRGDMTILNRKGLSPASANAIKLSEPSMIACLGRLPPKTPLLSTSKCGSAQTLCRAEFIVRGRS